LGSEWAGPPRKGHYMDTDAGFLSVISRLHRASFSHKGRRAEDVAGRKRRPYTTYSVTCLSPHCLQMYLTRVAPFSA
jgi:hypothetical protein